MTWVQGLAGAGAAGLLIALIGRAWPVLTDAASAQFLPTLVRQAMPLLIVVALCLVVTPIAVYFATSDE